MGAAREPAKQKIFSIVEKTAQHNAEPSAPKPAAAKARVFPQVPTHVVGMPVERRRAPRAYLKLPMRLTRVADRAEPVPVTLLTQNISTSGIFFLAPRAIGPGTSIELEVGLLDRPIGQGSVRMLTAAHVVRSLDSGTPGWHGVAARFDDFDFQRDEKVPVRFQPPEY